MLKIYIDADSCPVKDEVYRVAYRHTLRVYVVANQSLMVPEADAIELVLVGDRFDEADDWIAERVTAGDLVITGDILLAARCLEQGARVIGTRGRIFKDASIGDALAAREAAATLREMGIDVKGPAPFEPRDRSRFLQAFEELIQAIKRGR